MTNDNPHNFDEELLEKVADASGKMYDVFYDLLADYQFDFSKEEKSWMLERITKDIQKANEEAEQGRLTCCDGTGWTGDPKAPCPEHYTPHGLGEFGMIGVVY